MKYARVLSEFYGRQWALPEELLLRMQELLGAQASGADWDDHEIRNRIAGANAISGHEDRGHLGFQYLALNAAAAPASRSGRAGQVAVIPVTGIIAHRMNLISQVSGAGGTSIEKLKAQLREALGNVQCKAIVLDVDSPGGSVDCVPELASEIYGARKQKPIIAVCNSMACSAAYWLASAAGEVVCTPSGQCGSIGVYMLTQDQSEALKNEGIKITIIKAGKYKAEGHPAEPLSDDARSFLQSQVDDVYAMFVKAVAQQRGVSQTAVREGMGQGRSLLAKAAVKQNLVDRVDTLDSVLTRLGVPGTRGSAQALNGGGALATRRRQLALMSAGTSTASPDDDDEDGEPPCGCPCQACRACTGDPGARAKDGHHCICECQACHACDYKTGAKGYKLGLARRRQQLDLIAWGHGADLA
jgi:signal peptide peptidase SppA